MSQPDGALAWLDRVQKGYCPARLFSISQENVPALHFRHTNGEFCRDSGKRTVITSLVKGRVPQPTTRKRPLPDFWHCKPVRIYLHGL